MCVARLSAPLCRHTAVKDINITLMRSPQELKEDHSLFMNQGEWELLHVLSAYKSFSLDNDDYYAEMKFHVSSRFILSSDFHFYFADSAEEIVV